jgi:hypothetical protein
VVPLAPSPVPSLLLNYQCLAVRLSSLLEVSTIIKALATSEVVVVDVSRYRELHGMGRAVENSTLAVGQQVANHLIMI